MFDFNKNDFIRIINLYHPNMNYYQLIRIYFKILDGIYPNQKFIGYNSNDNVFDRLYNERKVPYKNCCTFHSSLKNLQKRMKKQLKTDYELKMYQKASDFFTHLNLYILIHLDCSHKWNIFKDKYSRKIFKKSNLFNQEIIEKEFGLLVRKKLEKWDIFSNFVFINRKGNITNVEIPEFYLKKLKIKYTLLADYIS